jgi:hypothetical protein
MIGVAKPTRFGIGEVAIDRPASVASRPLPPKVHALFAKAKYQAPKVLSFPIDGMTVSSVTFAGNS